MDAASGEKPDAVRTHLRNMIIVPEMIGSVVHMYNGKTFNQLGAGSCVDCETCFGVVGAETCSVTFCLGWEGG
jgi:hypothetical protein